jgi:hypothetical protein
MPGDALGLTTNLLLPADATVAFAGKQVSLAAPMSADVPQSAVVTVSLHGATVAIRLVHVDTARGSPAPRWSLVVDTDGLKHHTARLTLSHFRATQKPTDDHVRVAFFISAEAGNDATVLASRVAEATLTDSIAGDTWTVGARLNSLSLEVKRSMKERDQIVSQTINGLGVAPGRLTVDGKDLATPIWATLPADRQ